MPDQVYKPVKFFSVDTGSEAEAFVTDELDVILTDEGDESITAG